MPRIPHSILLRGYKVSSLLPLIIQGTRTLSSAISELKWLTEHVLSTAKSGETDSQQRKRLLQLCIRRSRAEPLQYLLGSQPFGNLNVKCRPGVLIPRPETEAYTIHLANLILDGKLDDLLKRVSKRHGSFLKGELPVPNEARLSEVPPPRILDLCSGSGCISLLLHSMLSKRFKNISITGIDISQTAVALARENLTRNIKLGNLGLQAPSTTAGVGHPQVRFRKLDIFDEQFPTNLTEYSDVIISNPPYISESKFLTETTRSVRNYEPRLALVGDSVPMGRMGVRPFTSDPGVAADLRFYSRLLFLHHYLKNKILIMELGDEDQARRIVGLATESCKSWKHRETDKLEIWRNWPDQEPQSGAPTVMKVDTIKRSNSGIPVGKSVVTVPIRGSGNIRSVVLFRGHRFVYSDLVLAKTEADPEYLASSVQAEPSALSTLPVVQRRHSNPRKRGGVPICRSRIIAHHLSFRSSRKGLLLNR